jgi:thioredoxin reductase (NADPH)
MSPETAATETAERPTASARAVILTVDDDLAVSRAVARDLRRRYGESHRIVRASSGAEALEALRELKLRGEQVAVLLADYRMPEMSGIEFLEEAMDLFPLARRALLTAYADTDAAIAAINVVDIDHYLLKPWDPPEEKLFPVIDLMVEAYDAHPETPITLTKVIGHRWSPPSFEMRDFLARNAVPYRWFASDESMGRKLLKAAGQSGDCLPVVIAHDGQVMVQPTPAEVADAVGLTTTVSADVYDLVIIGGGPAGLGAAVYGASEGLRTLIVERRATGGQAGQSSRIENYLGFPDGIPGAQLTERARMQAQKFGAEILTTRAVEKLVLTGSAFALTLDDGQVVNTHSVVIASGVAYRTLQAPGVELFTGRGVYYGSASTEVDACVDRDVYIVGGANSAGQAAVYFSKVAKSVTIVIRGESLDTSMSSYLIDQIKSIDNISVRNCTVVAEAHGDDHLEGLTLLHVPSEARELVDASHCFVFIGAQPQTDWLDGVLVRDERGFVLTGPDLVVGGELPRGWRLERDPWPLEASLPGVFVAGDVRSDSVKRVASAVGEGAMAVTLVHRFLGAP